jgi:hypothetical protein
MDALNRWLVEHDWMPLIVWVAMWGGLLALCIALEG